MERFIQDNLPWIYAIALSVWASLVQYAGKVRTGEERWHWGNFLLDIILCSFSGLVAFFLCGWQEISGWQMALVVSISAHQGPRAIGILTHLRDKAMVK